jgi:hypothetical protein
MTPVSAVFFLSAPWPGTSAADEGWLKKNLRVMGLEERTPCRRSWIDIDPIITLRCIKISCNIDHHCHNKQFETSMIDITVIISSDHASSILPIWGRIESCRNARFYFEQYNPALESYCPWSINIRIPYLRCKVDNPFEVEWVSQLYEHRCYW